MTYKHQLFSISYRTLRHMKSHHVLMWKKCITVLKIFLLDVQELPACCYILYGTRWIVLRTGSHYKTKNAFQSKAHLPLANRKSTNTYKLTLEWPWPWDDIDLVYDLDVLACKTKINKCMCSQISIFQCVKNSVFYVNCSASKVTDWHYLALPTHIRRR